jgi:pyruvate dehydrogenase E1 component alpha subunit
VPIGTGLAFAKTYRKNNKIAVTYLGDGAINQGQVYESFNMAKLWNLPVIYVVENNEYAMGTAVRRSSSEVQLYKRGLSFGIPGEQVDGMDVIKVHEAAQKAADFVRSGNGPIILEMKTYRYRGHSMSDPAKYRSKEEVEEYKLKHDPIERLKAEIESRFKVKEEALEKKVESQNKHAEKEKPNQLVHKESKIIDLIPGKRLSETANYPSYHIFVSHCCFVVKITTGSEP